MTEHDAVQPPPRVLVILWKRAEDWDDLIGLASDLDHARRLIADSAGTEASSVIVTPHSDDSMIATVTDFYDSERVYEHRLEWREVDK